MKKISDPTTKYANLGKEELLVLLSDRDTKLDSLEKQVTELEWYKQQVMALNKARMGTSSEKIAEDQLNLFNEIEEFMDVTVIEPTVVKKKAKNKKMKETDFSKLPSKVIHHELDNKCWKKCQHVMGELKATTTHILKYQPSRYSVETHITHNYVCKSCSENSDIAHIESAEGAPQKLIPGSVVSSSVIAGFVTDKYCNGMPLYRIEPGLKRRGIPISRANISNWLAKVSSLYLEAIYGRMLRDLRSQSVLHMDETSLTVLEDLKTGRSKSYEWVMVSGACEEKQIVLYHYNHSREHGFAKELLGDFKGYVQSDGYEAYQKVENTINVGCMVHARRKFVEAMESSSVHKTYKQLSTSDKKAFLEKKPSYYNMIYILNLMSQLSDKEHEFDGLDPKVRQERRQMQCLPIVDELFATISRIKGDYPTKSKMGVAIAYAINNERYLRNYLLDGRLELTNNRAERAIKPFVIGHKNFLFSNTKNGAQMSSIYYSLVESAKLNNLDIKAYFEYILDELTYTPESWWQETIQRLLPYSKELTEHVYAKLK